VKSKPFNNDLYIFSLITTRYYIYYQATGWKNMVNGLQTTDHPDVAEILKVVLSTITLTLTLK
jgi:hypothetical protein